MHPPRNHVTDGAAFGLSVKRWQHTSSITSRALSVQTQKFIKTISWFLKLYPWQNYYTMYSTAAVVRASYTASGYVHTASTLQTSAQPYEYHYGTGSAVVPVCDLISIMGPCIKRKPCTGEEGTWQQTNWNRHQTRNHWRTTRSFSPMAGFHRASHDKLIFETNGPIPGLMEGSLQGAAFPLPGLIFIPQHCNFWRLSRSFVVWQQLCYVKVMEVTAADIYRYAVLQLRSIYNNSKYK